METGKAQQLVDDLYRRALEADREAARFRGTSSPAGFGPCREAETWTKALGLAAEALGVRPNPEILKQAIANAHG